MTDRKKPGVAFWATVALVVVLVGYPLSIGPWFWVVTTGRIPISLIWIDHAYDPLRWIIERSPGSAGELIHSYISLWLPAEPFEYHGE
jgi:hypothetical protein